MPLYISSTGTPSGDGTKEKPWDMMTAVARLGAGNYKVMAVANPPMIELTIETPTAVRQFEFKRFPVSYDEAKLDVTFKQMGDEGYGQCGFFPQSASFYAMRIKGSTAKFEWKKWPWRNGTAQQNELVTLIGNEGYSNPLIFKGQIRASKPQVSASLPTVYEAENAILVGCVVSKENPGYTGTGYVDFLHPSGDSIEWTVNVPVAGSYTLKFRYSNGDAIDRPLELRVNQTIVNGSLPFSPIGSWSNWSISSSPVSLNAGVNVIKLTAVGSSGANIDSLSV